MDGRVPLGIDFPSTRGGPSLRLPVHVFCCSSRPPPWHLLERPIISPHVLLKKKRKKKNHIDNFEFKICDRRELTIIGCPVNRWVGLKRRCIDLSNIELVQGINEVLEKIEIISHVSN